MGGWNELAYRRGEVRRISDVGGNVVKKMSVVERGELKEKKHLDRT